jgi:hypothetical protein
VVYVLHAITSLTFVTFFVAVAINFSRRDVFNWGWHLYGIVRGLIGWSDRRPLDA